MTEVYKFQKLRVYQLALDYVDAIYALSHQLPEGEKYNLRSQMERAAASIVLNIAEGSTGQTDAEQNRFLGHAVRSYLETIACFLYRTFKTNRVPLSVNGTKRPILKPKMRLERLFPQGTRFVGKKFCK